MAKKPQVVCELCPKGNPAISFITDPEGHGLWFFTVAMQMNDIIKYDTKENKLAFHSAYASNGCFVMGGDSVDKGPNDRAIVKALTQFKRDFPHRVFLILGNRDVNKLRFYHELGRDPNSTADLPNEEDVSKCCYWDLKVYNETGDPMPNGYPAWRKKVDAPHCWISILKWMLACTMGCPETFKFRRMELAQEQNCSEDDISDEMVYRDFYDSVDPKSADPWMLEYVQNGQICARLHSTIFLHGSITKSSIRTMPRGCDPLSEKTSLTMWFHALNIWARKLVNAYVADPAKAYKDGIIQPLLDYGLPSIFKPGKHVPSFHHGGNSIMYNHWLHNGNAQPIDTSVYELLAENGVDVLTGHQPHGDCPMVMVGNGNLTLEQRYAHIPVVMSTDTSYSDGQRHAFSTISIYDTYLEVKGRLANGNFHGYIIEKSRRSRELTPIGKRLPDHSWTKTRTQGQLMCVRGEGFKLHTRMLQEEYVNHLVQSESESFPRCLGPFGVRVVENAEAVLNFDFDNLTWTREGSQVTTEHTKAFDVAHGSPKGGLSPFAPVTFDGAAHKAAQIPKNAESFAFIYPVAIEDPADNVDYSDALIVLFTVGGFVYLDSDKKVVQVTALMQQSLCPDVIMCDQPMPWYHNLTVELAKKNRFHKITTVGENFHWFSWLAPGETLKVQDKELVLSQHGAWVFLTHAPDARPTSVEQAACVVFHVVGQESFVEHAPPDDIANINHQIAKKSLINPKGPQFAKMRNYHTLTKKHKHN